MKKQQKLKETEEYLTKYNKLGFVVFYIDKIKTHIVNGEEKKILNGIPKKHQDIKESVGILNETTCVGTGERSNLTVIDIDKKETYDKIIKEQPELKKVYTVSTNKGYHLYFKYCKDIGSKTNWFVGLDGVDCRSEGGFVVAPPTSYKLANGEVVEYKYIGGEVVDFPDYFKNKYKDFVRKKEEEEIISEDSVSFSDESSYNTVFDDFFGTDEQKVMDMVQDGLLDHMAENYTDWSNVGFAMKNCVSYDCFDKFSRKSVSKYNSENCFKFWNSIKGNRGKKLTIGSLIYWAKQSPKYDGRFDKKVKEEKKKEEEEEIVMTDSEIAEYVLEQHKGEIINNNGILYAYYKNSWTTDIDAVFTQWLSKTSLIMNSKKKTKVKDNTKNWAHYRIQMNAKCIEELSPVNVLNKDVNLLPFLDGVYNIETKVFKTYEEFGICHLTYCVNRKFPKDRSKIAEISRIITDIFDDDTDSIDECFSFWSRGLGRNVKDKVGLLLVGERNSGKGVIVNMFEKSFIGVVGNLLSGGLSSKMSFESQERKNGFLEPMCENVLCFSQEIDPKLKFDGTLWRTLVSGGDDISYRAAYGKLQTKSITALPTFTSNVIISFDQKSSSDTLLVYNMPCQYREDITNAKNEGYKVKQANPNIKLLLQDDAYLDAFTLFVLDRFKINKPKYTKLKQNNEEIGDADDVPSLSIIDCILSKYVFNKTSDVLQTEVHKTLMDIDKSFRPAKIKNVLEDKGVLCKIVKGTRYYRGLMKKDEGAEESPPLQ